MKVVCICGSSSSGKDSILSKLISYDFLGFKPLISHTTRPMRESEREAKDYFFVTNEEFKKMEDNNEFIEFRNYKVANGELWRYGLSGSQIDINSKNTYVVILDLQGLLSLEEYIGKENVISIFVDTKPSTRLIRSINRQQEQINKECEEFKSTTVNEIIRRLEKDSEDFIHAKEICDHTIINETEEDLDEAIRFICRLI